MKRTVFCAGLAIPLFLALSASVLELGCYVHSQGCGYRNHPGHLDEYGEPDPCCWSAVPCCANPLWGRVAKRNDLEIIDPCCIEVPCPGWDINKGADAGPDSATPESENDAGTSPEAGMQEDAGADGGR